MKKNCPRCRAEHQSHNKMCDKCLVYFRPRSISYRQTLRRAVLAGYGPACTCCGEAQEMFLEVDHVNGGGSKERRAGKNYLWLMRHIIELRFPKEYQIMCRNCNYGRWRNKGVCPHKEPK